MNYKFVLLDWDGCIAKTLDIWLNAYKKRNATYGVELSDLEIVKDFFGTEDRGPLKHGLDPIEYYAKLLTEVRTELGRVKLEDEVESTLRELKSRGHKMAIVSTSNKELVLEALGHNNIVDLIDTVIGYEDTGKHKPNPEPLIKAIAELDADKNSTIMMGDSDKDVFAAKNAQIPSILFYPQRNEKYYPPRTQKDLDADYLIRSFTTILDIV